jgi:murein tripeptide amidase MpaA
MILLTLSTNPSAGKKKIWLDAGLHSREWITVPTVTYIAETILRGYGTADGASSTYLLDTFDFLISPVLNVDGYDYTWNSDRMWRKTRAPNAR